MQWSSAHDVTLSNRAAVRWLPWNWRARCGATSGQGLCPYMTNPTGYCKTNPHLCPSWLPGNLPHAALVFLQTRDMGFVSRFQTTGENHVQGDVEIKAEVMPKQVFAWHSQIFRCWDITEIFWWGGVPLPDVAADNSIYSGNRGTGSYGQRKGWEGAVSLSDQFGMQQVHRRPSEHSGLHPGPEGPLRIRGLWEEEGEDQPVVQQMCKNHRGDDRGGPKVK